MNNYKSYSAYKDVAITWLGKIPSHWHLSSFKYYYHITLGKMLQSEAKAETDILAPYLRSANVLWKGIDVSTIKEMWFSSNEIKQYKLEYGDLVVNEGGDAGRAAIWRSQIPVCYIQNAVHRVRSRNGFTNEFAHYWLFFLKKAGYIELICNKATIMHLTVEKLSALPLIVVPMAEQQAIVTFLNRETAKIDTLIAKKYALIEGLQEKRTALISHAVTRGLNPNAPMKDSGVGWLGEIPEEWKTVKLKFVAPFQYGNALPRENREDGTIPVYGSNGIVGYHNIANTQGPCLVIGRKGSYGKVNYSEVNSYVIDTAYFVDTTTTGHSLRWLYYLLPLLGLDLGSQDSAVPGLSREHAHEFLVPKITIEEQQAIVVFLDYETEKLDKLIRRIEQGITQLEEYRTALITAAITGKINVQGNV